MKKKLARKSLFSILYFGIIMLVSTSASAGDYCQSNEKLKKPVSLCAGFTSWQPNVPNNERTQKNFACGNTFATTKHDWADYFYQSDGRCCLKKSG
jgi:hypothetical protein